MIETTIKVVIRYLVTPFAISHLSQREREFGFFNPKNHHSYIDLEDHHLQGLNND